MEVVQEQRKQACLREYREDVLNQRLETGRKLVCLERLMRRVNGEVEKGKDGLELRSAFVKKRDILQLRSQSLLEVSDKPMEVRMEHDQLSQNVRKTRQLRKASAASLSTAERYSQAMRTARVPPLRTLPVPTVRVLYGQVS